MTTPILIAQTDNLLFDGAGSNEAVDGDGALLSDAMGTVAGQTYKV